MSAAPKVAQPRPLSRGELHRLDANFYVVDRLREALSNGERASILLRLPDDIVMTKAFALTDVCNDSGFPIGADFLQIRMASFTATRQPNGELPKVTEDQLRYWRSAFAAAAGAKS